MQSYCSILSNNTKLKGSQTIACDGNLAVDRINLQKPITPREAHHDLLGAILMTTMAIPIQITLRHMKGHQDDGTPTTLN